MNTKDRLKAFLQHIGLSQNKFETQVGLSNGFVNNVGESIRTENLQKITDKFPLLNTAWLLTGVGEMIKAPFNADDPVNMERAQIIALQKEVAMLKSMVYEIAGKTRSYEECFDDIENGTIVALDDLRRSGRKRESKVP